MTNNTSERMLIDTDTDTSAQLALSDDINNLNNTAPVIPKDIMDEIGPVSAVERMEVKPLAESAADITVNDNDENAAALEVNTTDNITTTSNGIETTEAAMCDSTQGILDTTHLMANIVGSSAIASEELNLGKSILGKSIPDKIILDKPKDKDAALAMQQILKTRLPLPIVPNSDPSGSADSSRQAKDADARCLETKDKVQLESNDHEAEDDEEEASDQDGMFVKEGPDILSFDDIAEDPRMHGQGRKRKATLTHSNTRDHMTAQSKRRRTAKPSLKKSRQKSKATGRKRQPPTMSNLNSLMGADVFKDAERVAHLRSQPTFSHDTRRDQQLKELVANLPQADKASGHADKRTLEDALKQFTRKGSVKGKDGSTWLVAGMKTPLKAYQVLGVGFMRQREKGTEEPRGGLNADQMGLGKTICTLANIVNGQLDEEPDSRKPTLIVASPALIRQWRAEIAKHVQNKEENRKYGLGTVIQHRAGARMVSNNMVSVLSAAAVILTTYYEVGRSYPKCVIPEELTTAKQKDEWWKHYYEEHKGVLHQIQYRRVVLDEAQAIKNYKGHCSQAVRALDAQHHWAISGTPILNNLKEFYPYFKFLKVPQTGSYKLFKESFCTLEDPDGTSRLAYFLNQFMLRRTHSDKLFNSRLLDLPTPIANTCWLEFNVVERSIYEIVKKRMITRINAFSKAGGLRKDYSSIWIMILRLRQLCGHILTIQETIEDILEREDYEELNQLALKHGQLDDQSTNTLFHLQELLAKNVEEGSPEEATTVDGGFGGRHALAFDFTPYLDKFKDSKHFDEMKKRSHCTACKLVPTYPQITSCGHIYCKVCIEQRQRFAARRGLDGMLCMACGVHFDFVRALSESEHTYDTEEDNLPESLFGKKKAGNRAKKNGVKDGVENWINIRGEVLPSAKTTACKAQLLNWFKESPGCKVIIFTQFLAVIRILAKVCFLESWKCVQYHGGMSHDSRQKSIDEFGDEKQGVQIMLASLKCGGLGLNLTMAQRVICFDPWWNAAVEQQAFCRVYRIGQDQETKLTRFLVKNTIEAAMMAMKLRKQVEIDEVMNSAKTRLDVKDLMRLFGDVGHDEHGRPIILPNTVDEEGNGDGDDEEGNGDDSEVHLHREDDPEEEMAPHLDNQM